MAPLPFVPTALWRADRTLFHLPGGIRITYGDAADLSGRLANLLLARGARPGDRIAVQLEKSWEGFALYLACLRAGIVYLPLNPGATAPEVEHVLADATPKVAVRDRAFFAEAAGHDPAFDAAPPDPEALAALLYTSGTTGRPKGAMLSHRALAFSARALSQAWRFTPDDVLLHALPLFHVHGLFIAANTALAAGASMRFLPRFDPDAVLGALPESTVLMGVPTYYVRLLKDPRLDRQATRAVRLCVSGSAPLSIETFREWRSRTGHTILERYGMTETSVIASNPYEGERREGAVGFPVLGTELRIVESATGRPVAQGQPGSVEVRGPHLFSGYWQRPETRATDFRDFSADGFFRTGDLGRIDSNGYLHLVGRSKDLIISGGYNVYPKEVEAAVEAIPGVSECAVVGLPDPDLGEAVAAVVVSSGLNEAAILEALKEQLARYKLPRRVVFVEALPRNTMGKVLKTELRDKVREKLNS